MRCRYKYMRVPSTFARRRKKKLFSCFRRKDAGRLGKWAKNRKSKLRLASVLSIFFRWDSSEELELCWKFRWPSRKLAILNLDSGIDFADSRTSAIGKYRKKWLQMPQKKIRFLLETLEISPYCDESIAVAFFEVGFCNCKPRKVRKPSIFHLGHFS